MRLLLASVVLTLFFSLPARAESWCRALTWPVSRDSSLSEMKEDLAKIDRFELVQLAWGELTTEQKKPMFAPILMYLAGTENDADLRGYYKAMGYFALGKTELPEALKEWPKRAPYDGKGFPLSDLCKMYRESGGKVPSEREPDSQKPKAVKRRGKHAAK
jgi:hypothetical protein